MSELSISESRATPPVFRGTLAYEPEKTVAGVPQDMRGPAVPATEPKPKSHPLRTMLTVAILGLTAAVGGSAAALSAVGPPVAASIQHVINTNPDIQQVKDFTYGPNTDAEPQSQFGKVYELKMDGSRTDLANNGATTPTGHTVPADAIVNNRAAIFVEGIDGEQQWYANDVHNVLQKTIGQPIIMVHEGIRSTKQDDILLVGRDLVALKGLQAGVLPPAQALQEANDPSVKAVMDLVQQQLDAKHDVLLVPHSGGGAETALALTLLGREGQYAAEIQAHVRVMALTPAAPVKDFVDAGVAPKNLYFTASTADPVYNLVGRNFVSWNPKTDLHDVDNVVAGLEQAAKTQQAGGDFDHDLDDLVDLNNQQVPHGMQNFLAGGPGGVHIVTPPAPAPAPPTKH